MVERGVEELDRVLHDRDDKLDAVPSPAGGSRRTPTGREEGDVREISPAITGLTVRYIRRTLGAAGVEQLLASAGDQRSAAQLENGHAWSTNEQAVALLEAAVAVTGDPDVARSIGASVLLGRGTTGIAATLRSLGSPTEVLRNIAASGARFSTGTEFEPVDVDEGAAVVAARSRGDAPRHRLLCQYTVGALSQVGPLFGLPPARVVEHECQAAGGHRCVYEVRWQGADPATDLEHRVAHLQEEVAAAGRRFDAIYSVATEVVSAGSVPSVLARLTASAGSAVRAPAYVLAVRLPAHRRVEVHHHGMSGGEADGAARLLLDPTATVPDSWVVADIASTQRAYGRLAAVFPDGYLVLPVESRLLEVYARFAAAVLDTATAREEAEERDATARALLQLASALAQVGTRREVAARLAAAVPVVVGCNRSGVFEWDTEREELRGLVSHGLPPDLADMVEHLVVHRHDTPAIDEMLRRPAPVVLERGRIDPFITSVFDRMGFNKMVVVPLLAHGVVYGVLAAGSSDGVIDDYSNARIMERLIGLTGQAAMAFGNAALLEEARHQALHDPLTGLGNRRLLEEAADEALATASATAGVALVFFDLDTFKAVNDALGHAAGDELLRHVAHQLERSVRAGDTVARVSGDEFAVLLPGLAAQEQAEAVAAALAEAVTAPVTIAGTEVRVTASVGVALAPRDGRTYGELLHQADTAMYRVKWGRQRLRRLSGYFRQG